MGYTFFMILFLEAFMREKRIHDRVPYRVDVECIHYYKPDGSESKFNHPVHMDVFDLSLGGIGIITKTHFDPGTVLVFTLYLENVPYTVMALVRWHHGNDFTNRYGLEFIGPSNMMFRHLKTLTHGESLFQQAGVQEG